MATSPFSFKEKGDGMATSPLSLNEKGDGMATSAFSLKEKGDGMATTAFTLKDKGDGMVVITRGSVKVSIGDLVVDIMGRGAVIGEMAVLGKECGGGSAGIY